MKEAAEKQGKDAEIFAVSASEADHELDSKKIDVVLLGHKFVTCKTTSRKN